MNADKKIVLGIDLGTTYSCMAYVDDSGKPQVITNSTEGRTTPSVVWFDAGTATVGDEAKNMAKVEPDEVVSFVKRYMGDPDYFFESKQGRMRPEEISSYILRKLVQDASEKLNTEIRDVVITCPAYFSTREREATKKAGVIAGLNVVQILNEPTAAAISYGMANSGDTTRNILVYDLGGGTFDVTMIQVVKGRIEVVCTGGYHHLGGKDWDDVMTQIIIEKYKEESGDYDTDLLSNAEATQELMLLSEKLKIQLSQRPSATDYFTFNGERHRVTVTQEEFESETAALLDRTLSFTVDMLADARAKGVNHFDELLLVGGSSKMPQVKRALEEKFHMTPRLYDPDESVAKGAAIVGASSVIRSMIEEAVKQSTGDDDFTLDVIGEQDPGFELAVENAKKALRDDGFALEAIEVAMTEVINVASKTFGTLSVPGDEKEPRLFNLIYRNQSLPAEVEFPCGTLVDNQQSVLFQVIESNEDEPKSSRDREEVGRRGLKYEPGDCHVERWKDNLALPPGMPRGEPLSVMFKMDKEGLLDVTCVHVATGRRVHTIIRTGAVLSKEEEREIDRRSKNMEVV